jgi:hypothetical protein
VASTGARGRADRPPARYCCGATQSTSRTSGSDTPGSSGAIVSWPGSISYWSRTASITSRDHRAAGGIRAVEVLRYVEQQDQLDHLVEIVEQVMQGGGGQADPDPR